MKKVHINPNWHGRPDTGEGGIRRCTEAQIKHLPKFGWEFTDSPDEADLLANHSSVEWRMNKPIVCHNHGLMWSRYPWGQSYKDINKMVTDSMRIAHAHTVPSEWVAVSVRRGMLVQPEVVYHGIDIDDWKVSPEPGDYVLWNKARVDYVSNPNDPMKLSTYLQDVKFKLTHGNPAKNVEILLKPGKRMPLPQMKEYIMNAGILLQTTRETFGIGMQEAMACAVPVVGWDWGGASEIIKHGETGLLAQPGNFEQLAEYVRVALENRERLGENARQDIIERWSWEPRIQQYADIYDRTLDWWNGHETKVSVIVNAYNLEKYLVDCLKSIQKQTLKDFECIIVDDFSTDDTEDIAKKFCTHDRRFRYVRPTRNIGLSAARNLGFRHAKGRYIRYMDGDDTFSDEHTLQLEVDALDQDPLYHIVYGHLQSMTEEGEPIPFPEGQAPKKQWPPPEFSWEEQMAHLNQLPSTNMMRREVIERSGGIRTRYWRNEDAPFWCLVTSLGFQAKKFTDKVTMFHRNREDSKGALEFKHHGGEGDWTAWFPWRFGARSPQEGWQKLKQHGWKHPDPKIVPFGAQGTPDQATHFWYVHDYSYPNVSVIVTVGPKHRHLCIDAVESVLAQSYPDWELVVVNATGEEWPTGLDDPLCGAPYAKLINPEPLRPLNPAEARNLGAKHTKAPLMVWLDADDYWLSNFLERMVAMYEENEGLIFSYLLQLKEDVLEPYTGYPEFECGAVLEKMRAPGSSILVPRWAFDKVVEGQGGWDEQIYGWEDWDFQIALQAYAKLCFYLIKEPLFVYRFETTSRRERDYDNKDAIIRYIDEKWKPYRTGEIKMGCGCRKKKPKTTPDTRFQSSGMFVTATTDPPPAVKGKESASGKMVLVEYLVPKGENLGPFSDKLTLNSKSAPGQKYRFSTSNAETRRKFVYEEDIPYVLSLTHKHQRIFRAVEKS